MLRNLGSFFEGCIYIEAFFAFCIIITDIFVPLRPEKITYSKFRINI